MIKSIININQFKYDDSDLHNIFERDIYLKIIASNPFSRLKNIHFLGAIDYAIAGQDTRNKRQNTRYHHSLGVARLALLYSRLKGFSPEDEVLCVLSALLHDIGHAPLSHSMESIFIDRFNVGHHKASQEILKGQVQHLSSIWKIIDAYDINIMKIIMILNGYGEQKFRDIFDYPINIDTIEGILRCFQIISDHDVDLSADEVVKELSNITEDSIMVFDKFWNAKNEAYRKLIYSDMGVIADYLCQDYMRNQKSISEDFFYRSERQFRKKHSTIFNILSNLRDSRAPDLFTTYSIDYFIRVFDINENIIISNTEDLNFRYTYRKIWKHIDW